MLTVSPCHKGHCHLCRWSQDSTGRKRGRIMGKRDLPLTTTCQVRDVRVLKAVNKVSSNQHHTIRRVKSGMAANIARLRLGTRWRR